MGRGPVRNRGVNNSEFFQCPVCYNLEVLVSAEKWQCRGCGALFPVEQGIPILVPSWQANLEKLEQGRAGKPDWYVDEQPSEAASPWRHHLKKRRLYLEEALGGYLQGSGRSRAATLLDLGCGDGNNLKFLRKFGESVYASDYNLTRLVRARSRHLEVVLFLADILDYPARQDFFEIIFFNHVLEHIPEDERALQTVYRLLKPKGLLVLGVPNEGAWWWQLAYRLQPKTLQSTDHVHFYTAETIGQKLVSQGFTLLEIYHLGWGFPHWGIDARLRQYKVMDDLFEMMGQRLFPRQASSLYLLATKE